LQEEPIMNVVLLLGTLARDPEPRTLRSGSLVLTLDLTTRSGDEPPRSVPIAWFDPPDSSASLAAGDRVVVIGHVRRRFFRTGGATQSRTEVVAQRIVPARQAKRVQSAIDQALVQIATDAAGGGT
jgi:single-strand DNA-binding protein